MENTTLNTIRQHIIDNEKQPTYPYLDIKGNVTIGTGFKIDNEDAFAALPLVNKDTGKELKETEKRQAWKVMQRESERAIKAKDLNKDAESFEKLTNVRMPKAEQNKRLDREISERVDKIKNDKDVGADAWNKLTDGQKAVAVDIHYANGSLDGLPCVFASFSVRTRLSRLSPFCSAFTTSMGPSPSAPCVTAWAKRLRVSATGLPSRP